MLVLARERGDRFGANGCRIPTAVAESPIVSLQDVLTNSLVEYFRCDDDVADIGVTGALAGQPGYFRFAGATCYGRLAGSEPATSLKHGVPDVSAVSSGGGLVLPFEIDEVVTNLREERYSIKSSRLLERLTSSWGSRTLYYFLRPMLGVGVRRHLQKIRLTGWDRIPFPRWPVDVTVETLMRTILAASAHTKGIRKVPFIWFWPDGAQGCALMTHDVEGPEGAAFCGALMDLDDRYGIKAAFQLVPEVRTGDSSALRKEIRNRGFEANLHDLNHDGYLFDNRDQFLQRAAQINRYAREFDCGGFRSGAMYREQRWYDAFDISYDMSVPNVAHLEPQRGGCCTVMPYFVGKVLELPSTTIQDYSLFHILGDYSIRRWKEQCELILAQHGLMTFITHPDYLAERRALRVYEDLLVYLNELREQRHLWITQPGEVNRWWRNRTQMKLVPDGNSWRVEGPDAARARVAYVVVDGDQISYSLDVSSNTCLQSV
jgi:hypothetical protein